MHFKLGVVRGWKDARTWNDADSRGMGVHWNLAERPGRVQGVSGEWDAQDVLVHDHDISVLSVASSNRIN